MGVRRGLRFEMRGDCMICVSHSHNCDGYLRLSDRRVTREGRKPLVMYHRLTYEATHGPIPAGYEVDHICRNRACQNIRHLQLLKVSEHKAKTNKERCDDKRAQAYEYWKETKCSNKHLEETYEVTPGTGARWHRYWKKQGGE